MDRQGKTMKKNLQREASPVWRYSAALTGLLAAVQLAGCVTDHAVVPRGADESTLAHVSYAAEDHPDTGDRRDIAVTEVDGKGLGGYWTGPAPRDIYLMPGTHRIKIMYWHQGMSANGLLTFDALPGVEYRVHTKAQGYDLHFWLTNNKGDLETTAEWEPAR